MIMDCGASSRAARSSARLYDSFLKLPAIPTILSGSPMLLPLLRARPVAAGDLQLRRNGRHHCVSRSVSNLRLLLADEGEDFCIHDLGVRLATAVRQVLVSLECAVFQQ